jgi:hypothetical protein
LDAIPDKLTNILESAATLALAAFLAVPTSVTPFPQSGIVVGGK